MKWEDIGLNGPEDLIEDHHTGRVLGNKGQLTVLGKIKTQGRSKNRHVISCSICAQDKELFGDGIFSRVLSQIIQEDIYPCGCSISPKWSEAQMFLRLKRYCTNKGWEFLGWVEEYKGNRTRVEVITELGFTDTMLAANVLIGQNSKLHRNEKTSQAKSKSDDVIIESFLKLEVFHEDTRFWKSDRVDEKGQRTFWWMQCGECGELGESYRSNLQKGKFPCACTRYVGQKKMYINLISDNSLPIALKFGKTHFPERRVKEQQSKSDYEIESIGVWEFEDRDSSTKAEAYCKEEFECGIVSSNLMRDGWSETTHVVNLEGIISIYESLGGNRIQ